VFLRLALGRNATKFREVTERAVHRRPTLGVRQRRPQAGGKRLALREPERSDGIRLVVEPLWASYEPVASARFRRK